MTTHHLKTLPAFFQPAWDGEKTFEVRYDDRGYQRGDVAVLEEYDRDRLCVCQGRCDATCGRYTGRTITAHIGHVTASTPARGGQRGFLGHGYVVFSLCEPANVDNPREPLAAPARTTRPSPADVAARARVSP